jgi:hypothetical protein
MIVERNISKRYSQSLNIKSSIKPLLKCNIRAGTYQSFIKKKIFIARAKTCRKDAYIVSSSKGVPTHSIVVKEFKIRVFSVLDPLLNRGKDTVFPSNY